MTYSSTFYQHKGKIIIFFIKQTIEKKKMILLIHIDNNDTEKNTSKKHNNRFLHGLCLMSQAPKNIHPYII